MKKKLEMCSLLDNTSYLFLSRLRQKRKLNIFITKIVVKKKESMNSRPTKRAYKINFSNFSGYKTSYFENKVRKWT